MTQIVSKTSGRQRTAVRHGMIPYATGAGVGAAPRLRESRHAPILAERPIPPLPAWPDSALVLPAVMMRSVPLSSKQGLIAQTGFALAASRQPRYAFQWHEHDCAMLLWPRAGALDSA